MPRKGEYGPLSQEERAKRRASRIRNRESAQRRAFWCRVFRPQLLHFVEDKTHRIVYPDANGRYFTGGVEHAPPWARKGTD